MTHVGRPRKPGLRTKSGKLKPEPRSRDHGTPELQAKRMAITREGNPELSTCPLDALLARELISQDQYNDASDYRRWYTIAIRRPIPSASGGGIANDEVDESKIEDAARKFKTAANMLLRMSRKVKDAVDNAVVYERWPHCLISDAHRKSDAALFDGLMALSAWRRGERKAA